LPRHRHGRVLRANQGKQVFARSEFHLGQGRELLTEQSGKLRVRVNPGAHRRTALRQRLQRRLQIVQMFDISPELLRPAVEHLAHAHGHGIHQVRTAGFDVLMNLLGFVLDNLHQMRQRGQQLLVQA